MDILVEAQTIFALAGFVGFEIITKIPQLLHTPLMWIDKAETWALAEAIGGLELVELEKEHTHTCYNGDRTTKHEWGYGCGECPACELRKSGYESYYISIKE